MTSKIPPRSQVAPFRAMDVLSEAAALERQGRRIIHMEVGEPGRGAAAGGARSSRRCARSRAGRLYRGARPASGDADARRAPRNLRGVSAARHSVHLRRNFITARLTTAWLRPRCRSRTFCSRGLVLKILLHDRLARRWLVLHEELVRRMER